jgi:hypothetical protein
VALLAFGATFQACGDDDDTCSDTEFLPDLTACEDYAADFDCSSSSYDADDQLCTVSGCACLFVVDDLDDF